MTDATLFDRYIEGERPLDTKTSSGLPLDAAYGPPAAEKPGQYPFTRGIHPEMYRKRFWTRRASEAPASSRPASTGSSAGSAAFRPVIRQASGNPNARLTPSAKPIPVML